jgi:outer membrane protein TolC
MIIMALALLSSGLYAADDALVKQGDTLTLQQCIQTALRKHPGVMASTGALEAARSRIGQAQSNYYPQINLSAGYSRISPAPGSAASIGGDYNQYSAGVSLSQDLYDFGKTSANTKIQESYTEAAGADLMDTEARITLAVKLAYYNVLRAKRSLEVAAETVRQNRQHLDQTEAFFKVGTRPKYDVIASEVNLSNARLNHIRAENALNLALASLNNAMGLSEAGQYDIEDNLAFVRFGITFEQALARAYDNRPDMKSASAKRTAAEKAVEFAGAGYYPVLTGNAAYNRSAEEFPLEQSWNAGVTLSFPLFNGFLTKSQVQEARANLKAAKANEDLLRQGIYLDVRQALLNLRQAEDSIQTAELTVKQATENLDIANGRYSAGVGGPIEVTDAQVLYGNAKLTLIQALSDYKVAVASIEKAMGDK